MRRERDQGNTMRRIDLTLPTPAENLALDEALLEAAEAGGEAPEGVLRFWEASEPMVVLGRAGRVNAEVHLQACRERGVPVLRRVSGGGTIVAGPGCLMYALVLSHLQWPAAATIGGAHDLVMNRIADSLGRTRSGIRVAGYSDLTLQAVESGGAVPLKFAGNALRFGRRWLLYHGAVLYKFDLPLISTLLKPPPREPDYREGRSHEAFVTNLPMTQEAIRQAIISAWSAESADANYPVERVAQLTEERYAADAWNFSR